MKVYVVLKEIVNRDGWSIGTCSIEKIFGKREKAEEYLDNEKKKSAPDYYCHKTVYTISEYDVIWSTNFWARKERIVINLIKTVNTLIDELEIGGNSKWFFV